MYRRIKIGAIILSTVAVAAFIGVQFLPVAIWQEPPGSTVNHVTVEGTEVETVAENLHAPWSIDFGPEGDIFFTERLGRVRWIEDGNLHEDPVLTLPNAADEGGTLGIALDPNFATNRYIYVYYTATDDTNQVSRFRFNGEELVEETPIIEDIPGSAIHNGGRLAFGPEGDLYITTGDADQPENAQDEDSLAGKILRVEADGKIPPDNPSADSPVYSRGHRNIQGLGWNQDGELYVTEHGPQAHDEINQIEAGANYGWPIVEGYIETGPAADAPVANYRNPVKSSEDVTWAPSGATFYIGDKLPEAWHDKFLFAGLRSQTIWRLNVDTGDLKNLFDQEYGRLRDIQQGPDGYLYVLTSNRDGRGNPAENDDRILRIVPSDNIEG